MIVRSQPLPQRRPTMQRLVLAFAAIAQLLLLTLSPIAEARESRSAVSHVEVDGTQKHHAHSELNCIDCIAAHDFSVPPRAITIGIEPARKVVLPLSAFSGIVSQHRLTSAPPRAPPATS